MKPFFTLLLIFLVSFCFANNIQLQKVSLSDTNRTAKTVNIKMNISWEHSWRDSINWDAAWIIVKFKEPKDSIWKWKHATLSKTGNNTGNANGVKIVVPEDLTGAFFYRSQIGEGNIASENVKLLWNYGAAGVTNIDSVEVRVFATEMVYVPEGSYCLGDGDGTKRSINSFHNKNAPNNYVVINDKWSPSIVTNNGDSYTSIGDDNSIFKDGFRISGHDGLDLNNDKIADNATYPTGFKAFYCMKYKVTQGQYGDFLNTIYAGDTTKTELEDFVARTADPYHRDRLHSVPKELRAVWAYLGDDMAHHYPDNYNRHSISFDSTQLKFIVSRPDRANNVMTPFKGVAFAEWAGLRPISELEFEKACRGPLPSHFAEGAWGDDSNIPTYSGFERLQFSGIENGTEYFKNYDILKRKQVLLTSGGDNKELGPVRVGIFASDTSNRITANATYYGIMDMSKITNEIVIPVSDDRFRNLSVFKNGNGKLSSFGSNHTFADIIDTVSNLAYPGFYKSFNVSARTPVYDNLGFRAVRLAPSDN